MPNLHLSLTDAVCARARSEPREYALHDIRQPGLSLRVQPSGARSWIMRTRVVTKQVKLSLGSFPETGVKEARQAAAALLSGVAPAPAALPSSPLFSVFQAEHELKHGRLYKPSGLRTYRSYVRLQLLPAFGTKRLEQITRPDVVSWFDHYSAISPGGANRALGILHQILHTAGQWGQLPADWINPTIGVRHNRRKVVGSFLSEAQMVRLGAVLNARIKEHGCVASALLRFLTLTGCRVGEAIDLEWRDVLTDRLRLRDSKTGARDVTIGAPVRRFLTAHRAWAARNLIPSSRDAVFPLPSKNEYDRMRTVWSEVRRDAELPATLRIHDLRHNFASHAVMSGETLLTTSLLLGHRRLQTTFRYAHLADETLLATAEQIGALLMMQAGGATAARL
jgi:integrase